MVSIDINIFSFSKKKVVAQIVRLRFGDFQLLTLVLYDNFNSKDKAHCINHKQDKTNVYSFVNYDVFKDHINTLPSHRNLRNRNQVKQCLHTQFSNYLVAIQWY